MRDVLPCKPPKSYAVSTALDTSGAQFKVGNRNHGAALVMGDFTGVKISPNGGGYYLPARPFTAWELDDRGKLWVKRSTLGAGELIVAPYSSFEEAERAGKVLAGQGPADTAVTKADSGPASMKVTIVATGAAALFARDARNLWTIVRADLDNTAAIFVAETVAKATAAAGFQLEPGDSITWYGDFATFSAASATAQIAEALL